MIIRPTAIPVVIEIVPTRFADSRGHFAETYHRDRFAAAGIEAEWVQDNQSYSATTGTVRGLHFQIAPFAQDKLVRVISGAIHDVAVDIRAGSPTYGQWVGVDLNADIGNQLFIPRGFAHGFVTLADNTVVLYKVSATYAPACEQAIIWNDPDIGIDWPLVGAPSLSEKDLRAPAFASIAPYNGEAN